MLQIRASSDESKTDRAGISKPGSLAATTHIGARVATPLEALSSADRMDSKSTLIELDRLADSPLKRAHLHTQNDGHQNGAERLTQTK